MPPMTSTIRSDVARMSSKSPRERVRTPDSSGRMPVACSTASARSRSRATNAAPTVPWPRSPTLKVASDISVEEVLVGLAAHDHAGLAVLAEDHRRARDAVVVVGHGEAVGPGDGRHDDVADAWIGQLGIADDHVGGLAVLADQMARCAAPEAVGDLRLVARAVEHRPQVV